MRLAVLADVHGNLPALEAVLDDVQKRGVDGTIVAGDLLVGAPWSAETVRLLRSLDPWMILGNRESYLLDCESGRAPAGWEVRREWAMLSWTFRHLDRETLSSIASLPEQRVVRLGGVASIRVVHGSPREVSHMLLPGSDPVALGHFRRAGLLGPSFKRAWLRDVLAATEEPVLVCGHTHIPWQQEQDGRLAVNPGAVSNPLDGDVRAQYALLHWGGGRWQAELRAVPYDLARVRAGFEGSGLLAEGGGFARACLLGIETGRNVSGTFARHAYAMAAQVGVPAGDGVPDPIWERAEATFDWEAAAAGRIG